MIMPEELTCKGTLLETFQGPFIAKNAAPLIHYCVKDKI